MDSVATTYLRWRPTGRHAVDTTGSQQIDSRVTPPARQSLAPPASSWKTDSDSNSTVPPPPRRLPTPITAAAIAAKQQVVTPDAAVLQIWEGTVLQVDWSTRVMQVLLNAKVGDVPPHTGQIELQWVAEQDLELVRPGAVFYLTLYKQTRKGSIQNSQELRFRRRPGWSDQQISQLDRDASLLVAKMKSRPIAE